VAASDRKLTSEARLPLVLRIVDPAVEVQVPRLQLRDLGFDL